MAINFPNSPVNGSTYKYNDVTYTFSKNGADEGYWKVTLPVMSGVASPEEVQEGANNIKYVTPKLLEESKYLRDYGGTSKFTQTYGGILTSENSIVTPYVLYDNRIVGHTYYGNSILIDAANYPAPIRYGDTDGGSLLNGVMGITERTGGSQLTAIGYRAGEGALGTDNVYHGIQAGEGANSESATFDHGNSIGVGRLALHDSVGYAVIAIGAEAANHSTSSRSIYMGSYSGNSATTDNSVGIGYRSLENNTGINATSVGIQSGQNNLGAYLTSFGSLAGAGNDGDYVIAIGPSSCGNSTSTADFNIGIGSRALINASGSRNVALGYLASSNELVTNYTWSNTVFVGHQAGYQNASDGSVGVGRDALKDNSEDYSTAVGYLAGTGNTHKAVTLLGAFAKANRDHQVVLGSTEAGVATTNILNEGNITFRGTDGYYKLTATGGNLVVLGPYVTSAEVP